MEKGRRLRWPSLLPDTEAADRRHVRGGGFDLGSLRMTGWTRRSGMELAFAAEDARAYSESACDPGPQPDAIHLPQIDLGGCERRVHLDTRMCAIE